MELAVLMRNSMLVAKMPCINAHPDPLKPGVLGLLGLLSCITVCVVEYVFRLLSARHRERILEHNQEVGYSLCPKHGSASKDYSARSDQCLLVMRSTSSKLCLDCAISSCRLGWTGLLRIVHHTDGPWILLDMHMQSVFISRV